MVQITRPMDTISKCFMINDWNEDCERISFKLKNNKLKIIWKGKQRIFPLGWQKDIHWLSIDKLTNDSLVLTLLPDKLGYLVGDNVWSEGRKVIFTAELGNCYDLFKKNK